MKVKRAPSKAVAGPSKLHRLGLALAASIVVSLVGLGCSSGLKYTVDDATMDNVPAGERQGVAEARKEAEVAENERRAAESQLEALDRDLDIAKKEREQAQLEGEKAVSE